MERRPLWQPERHLTEHRKAHLTYLRRALVSTKAEYASLEESLRTFVVPDQDPHAAFYAQMRSQYQERRDAAKREWEGLERDIVEEEKRPLSSWEKALTPDLLERFWDPHYLPSLAEADLIRPHLSEYSDDLGDHELLTREYIAALNQAIIAQVSKHLAAAEREQKHISVLEVGAGSGRLTFFLAAAAKQTLGQESDLLQWKAVDLETEGIPRIFPVERCSAMYGLLAYTPTVVLASWPRMDVGELVRRLAVPVETIILMGEPEICGGGAEGHWAAIPGYRQTLLKEATRSERGRTDGNPFTPVHGNHAHKTRTELFERRREKK